jgi:hypothetical protein
VGGCGDSERRSLGELLERVEERLGQLARAADDPRLARFLELHAHPRRLFVHHFLAGVARGLGIAVGFTLLGALVLYVLRELVMLNLPGIGRFVAQLVRIVEQELRGPRPLAP